LHIRKKIGLYQKLLEVLRFHRSVKDLKDIYITLIKRIFHLKLYIW